MSSGSKAMGVSADVIFDQHGQNFENEVRSNQTIFFLVLREFAFSGIRMFSRESSLLDSSRATAHR